LAEEGEGRGLARLANTTMHNKRFDDLLLLWLDVLDPPWKALGKGIRV